MITVQVSVSGGRTSAYMSEMLLLQKASVEEYLGDTVEYVFVFANTGLEHDDTLRFVNDLQQMLGLNLVWLEAEIGPTGIGTQHRIVSFDTAHRFSQWRETDHPFHAYIRKYGIPNVSFRGCTRDLKLRPIDSYMRSIGYKIGMYKTAIGIREDERRRVRASPDAVKRGIIYPLVDLFPSDKEDVLSHWRTREWDLKINEWQGNCLPCYKKSLKKLAAVALDNPEAFAFTAWMEAEYGRIGPEFARNLSTPNRTFFRGNLDTPSLLALSGGRADARRLALAFDGGCSESCEMLETEDLIR